MGAFGLAAGHCSGSHVRFLVARCPRAKLSAPVLFQENWRRASSSAFLAEKPLRLRDARPRRRQMGLRLWLPPRGHLLQSDFLPNLASCSARGGETHRQGPCHEHIPAATPLILNVLELEVYLFKKKACTHSGCGHCGSSCITRPFRRRCRRGCVSCELDLFPNTSVLVFNLYVDSHLLWIKKHCFESTSQRVSLLLILGGLGALAVVGG